MRTFTALLAFVAYVAAQSLTINTPAGIVQCQPAQITWTATNTPVFVSIIPGGQPGAAALQDFGQQTGQSLTWTVNIAAGTSITFQIRDSTGAVAYSAPATIQSSSDSSCLGQQPSTSAAATTGAASTPAASSAAASTSAAVSSAVASASSAVSSAVSEASTSAAATTATAPATSTRATSAAASTSRTATATSASAAASATQSNSATANKVGLAGLLGLAAAVVMA